MLALYFSTLVLVLLFASFVWFAFSIYTKRNDVADIAWGVNAVIIALFAYSVTPVSLFSPAGIIILLIIAWGTRLAIHLTKRKMHTIEDVRYRRFRSMWGKMFTVRSYFAIFFLQTMLIALISLPATYTALFGAIFTWNGIAFAGLGLWFFGFLYESIADYQLSRFLSDEKNKGRVLRSGLWAYSRHPNYFGEAVGWWGVFLLTVSFPYGLIAILSPLVITYSLLRITGIPLTEKSFEGNEAYNLYKKQVSTFIPLFRKNTNDLIKGEV